MTETQRIVKRIEQTARTAPSEEEVLAAHITEWLRGPKRQEMLTGARYYANDNDINYRQRLTVGEGGRLLEDTALPNRKVSHGFVRKLVDQKTQYLFGRPFTVSTDNAAFGRILQQTFDGALRERVKNLCREAVNKGIAWLQVWPEDGRLCFRKLPSEEVCPVWADGEHTSLNGLARVWQMECWEGSGRRMVTQVEYWDRERVRFYELKDGRLVPDPFCPERPHLTVDGLPQTLKTLPFAAFKYNEEELPLIRFIKPLVDDYDLLKSEDSSNLSDTSGAIMVLQNYDGTDLGEFRQNLQRYRAVKVSDNGGLAVREVPVHTADITAHLAQDRRDLYEIGRGVDTQNERLGQASGVAMRFLYADLDLDCSGIETQFAAGFAQLVRLAAELLLLMGQGDFTGENVRFIINRDMIINESDAIDGCVRSAGILSQQTILENHPWVVDAAAETARLEAEAEHKKEDSE